MSLSLREDTVEVQVPALRVTQPIGEFFVGVMTSRDLTRICDFDIRRLNTDGGIDDYLGIQREIDPKRIKELVKYIGTVDATFPTAVILAIDERCAEITPLPGSQSDRYCKLTLRNVQADDETIVLFRQIARILDGQHRVQALIESSPSVFDMNVAIFVGSDIATQAGIFSTVNLAQTKVNRSLVYDLFSYNRSRSPEKTCHEIAVVLDKEALSPFNKKIKRLGVATEGRFAETLSQATFVKGLMPYLSTDPISDRDLGKRERPFPRATGAARNKLIFRDFFVDNNDAPLASMLWDYFDCVRERWPDAWEFSGTGRILNKSTGFNALMRFLKDVYLYLVQPGQVVTRKQFAEVFSSIESLRDDDFTKENYIPGSSGSAKLVKELREAARIPEAK